jgi:predicted O-methyltransferase YrrM
MKGDYMQDKVSKIIEVRNRIEKDASLRGIPIVKPEVGQLLTVLTRAAKAKRVLEIGTAVGYSTLWFAEAICDLDGQIITIEKDEERAKEAKENFYSAGINEMVVLYNNDAAEILSGLNMEFDCIFLDAAKGKYIEYLPFCLKLLNQGGLLLADNVFFRGMVCAEAEPPKRYKTLVRKLRLFLEEIRNHNQLITTVLDLGDGLAISVRR